MFENFESYDDIKKLITRNRPNPIEVDVVSTRIRYHVSVKPVFLKQISLLVKNRYKRGLIIINDAIIAFSCRKTQLTKNKSLSTLLGSIDRILQNIDIYSYFEKVCLSKT